jgi:hypothetical protein
LRPLHIGDDIFGHPNGVIPTPFLLPNFVSNHLAIDFLFDHIGGVVTFVPPVGLGVDERTLDCKLLLVLLIRKLLLWLRTLVGLVAFLMALRASHGGPLVKLLHHVFMFILRRLDIALYVFVFNLAKSFMSLSTSYLSSSFSLTMGSSLMAFFIARVRARFIN